MRLRFFVSLLMVALAVSGCGKDPQPVSSQTMSTASSTELPNFTHLVHDNAGAVVNISTTHKAATTSNGSNRSMQDMLRQFFGDHLDKYFGDSTPQAREVRSLGSGFVLSKDGYILTNYHVIAGADSIVVRFNDRRELTAILVGKDKLSDVALLKVKAKDLQPVTIGSSANLQVGEWVVAIGAPFGFDSTVTKGIVSAKSRSLPNESYVPFIQTDVPINPGNSGGPLFNLRGEVVGINSQIISRSGGYMGLSFAVPIDLVTSVVDQLKAGKQVKRGWLGVVIQEVTHELADSFELDRPMGALVADVTPDSPAAKAGLKSGDVIVRFGDQVINQSAELPPMVGVTAPDTKVKLTVVREGKQRTITVKLGELPEDASAGTRKKAPSVAQADNRWGLVVAVAEGDVAATAAVQVTKVSGPAAAAGIAVGDLIMAVNNQTVSSVADFKRQIAKHKAAERLVLLIQHNGMAGFVVLHQPRK